MWCITPAATGAMMNCPNEPPALTMPVAIPRLSAGSMRVVAAISTEGPAMPAPPAASTPIANTSPAVLVISGVRMVPSATRLTPINSTRPAPTRSANAPAKGCVSPHQSWPKAKARLMLAMPRPVAELTSDRKRPIVCRVPIVSAKVPAAASRIIQTAYRDAVLLMLRSCRQWCHWRAPRSCDQSVRAARSHRPRRRCRSIATAPSSKVPALRCVCAARRR